MGTPEGGGQRRGDRGGGGGQGLPRGEDAGVVRLPGGSNVHFGTGAGGEVEARGEAGGGAEGGGEQPSSDGACEGEGDAAAAERGGGTDVRPPVRDRGRAAESFAWIGERDQALPDRGGGPQFGSDLAEADRGGQAEGVARGEGRARRRCTQPRGTLGNDLSAMV